jgi:response regulator RpfG family c-di-GMP phosphodiesterase
MANPEPGKVLLVDDDQRLTCILSAHLVNVGFEVRTARNGREGVEIALEFLPDVIVMDLSMPVMDGMEATARLKQDPRTQKTPIVILTAKSTTENLVSGLEAGALEYVCKPFSIEELIARVRSMHRLAVTGRELDRLNHYLRDEVARKTRRLELLYNYAQGLNKAASLDEVLDLVIDVVREATGSKRISFMLTEDDGQHLVCRRAVGIAPELVERIRVRAVEGIAGQVFSSGKTLSAWAIPNAAAAAAADNRYGSHAFLCTPLIASSQNAPGEILGVLNVTEKNNGESFSEEEIECIRSIADSAAIALHNQRSRTRLERSVQVLLKTVGRLGEYRDEETAVHLERVQDYVRILARELARTEKYRGVITGKFIDDLYHAAPLHDIGKVGVPDDILTKHGPLTEREFQIMKTHTIIGRQTLELALAETGPVPLLQMCIDIAHGHHEKFDGSGYPRGVSGEAIPLSARIIALADAYDAITSKRRYKDAIAHDDAVEIIRRESGKHFDPDVVAAFERRIPDFERIRCNSSSEAEAPAELVGAAV